MIESLCPEHMRAEADSWSPSYPKIGKTYVIVEPSGCGTCLDMQGRIEADAVASQDEAAQADLAAAEFEGRY